MIKLRQYHQDLLRQVQDALEGNAKAWVMMQLPAGGGKTIIARALLADRLTDGRKAVTTNVEWILAGGLSCLSLHPAHLDNVLKCG